MHNDPEAAIESFGRIEGKHAGIAAYHRMALLYQAKKYDAILEIDKERQKAIPESRSALASFFMGRSHYIFKKLSASCLLPKTVALFLSSQTPKKRRPPF